HQQDVEVDITMGEEERLWMCRNIPQDKHPEVGKPLTPKIFNGDRYCWGKDSPDYEDFFQSKENNGVFAFLGCSSSQALEKVRESKHCNGKHTHTQHTVSTPYMHACTHTDTHEDRQTFMQKHARTDSRFAH
uniref:Uncharacterized protein n=1 Tax=Gadus morhua TaxID=8049 RepID=A0A8C4ZZH2_GADMO